MRRFLLSALGFLKESPSYAIRPQNRLSVIALCPSACLRELVIVPSFYVSVSSAHFVSVTHGSSWGGFGTPNAYIYVTAALSSWRLPSETLPDHVLDPSTSLHIDGEGRSYNKGIFLIFLTLACQCESIHLF